MDIHTKINMCLDINFKLGPDAYAEEVAKHSYINSYGRRVQCTRLLDAPDDVVKALHAKLCIS